MWSLSYRAARGLAHFLFFSVGLVEILYEALDPEIHHLLGVSCSSSSCFRRASVTPWAILPQPERPIAQTINAIAATLLLTSISLCPNFPLLY